MTSRSRSAAQAAVRDELQSVEADRGVTWSPASEIHGMNFLAMRCSQVRPKDEAEG